MAKSRKKKRSREQRNNSIISRRDALLFDMLNKPVYRRVVLQDDRRRWEPYSYDQYKRLDGRGVDYEIGTDDQDNRRDGTRSKIAFANPRKVVVCRKRKSRRETLFKKGKIGRGKRVSRKRIMRDSSKIKC